MKKLLQTALLLASTLSLSANAGLLMAIDNRNDTLVSIDTDTLALTTIGNLGTNVAFGGLSYDSNSDTLYMVGGRNNENLYTVDMTTGNASLVGSHGIRDLFAIAFDTTSGMLYGSQFSGGTGLFSLDVSTGAATTINAAMATGIGGMTYNAVSDILVGMNDGAGDLYNVNRANGDLTLLFDGPFVNNSGLAFDDEKDVYWSIDYSGNLFSYDNGNGFARTTELSGLGNFDGLAYINESVTQPNDIPEPGALALFALGLLGLRKVRRS
ncbi:PEP-CTERM sorting domain-containing protein [Aliiglaciecola sp. M165]|uniref:PEP-CTERM sorting domain-containing protein n=1 Tax=Aliiglaciecola sp. M165 TaxID=2593649 RepID=UPI00117F3AB9|nr:PEP-CTERM sorting domain-containing protein [Aliiglaciecola sp. M165]TRY31378.1 DUF4394 domain-containing protein [Aliiglaciecola sp. M165]